MARQGREQSINSKQVDYEAASDDSSSWNHDLSDLDFQSKREKQGIMHPSHGKLGMFSKSLNGSMSVSPEKMKRGKRRELRNFLRVELSKVQGLSSKLEERESQLRRMYMSEEEIYPSLSDAELSRISTHVDAHERGSATTSNELFAPTSDQPSPNIDNPCLSKYMITYTTTLHDEAPPK